MIWSTNRNAAKVFPNKRTAEQSAKECGSIAYQDQDSGDWLVYRKVADFVKGDSRTPTGRTVFYLA